MIYLHIGTDKTGSTAIQKLLHWNRGTLLERGLLYPQAGVMHYDHARLKLALDAGDEGPWQRLREEVAEHAGLDVVLSHEGFYHLGPPMLERLRQWLPAGEVRVILYLRRQDDMIESGTLQQLKTRERVPDFDRLAEEMPWWPHLDYAAVVDRWQATFGRERITLRPYGRTYFADEQAIYRDFVSCLNRDTTLLEGLDWPARDPNPSLDVASAHALMFLHRLGLAPEQHDAVVDLLLHYQREHGKSEARLYTLEQRRALLQRYVDGNRRLDGIPAEHFRMEDEAPAPSLRDEEVANRLTHLYDFRRMLTGCREWYGEPGFSHLVESGRIQLKEGFYPLEKWGVWTRGDRPGRLVFRVPRTMVGNLELHIDAQFLPGVDTQSHLRVSGDEWIPLVTQTVVRVDSNCYGEQFGLVFLELKHDHPRTPFDAGVSKTDRRLMGAGIKRISFRELGNG